MGVASRSARGRSPEECCQENGWSIDERDGKAITLYFKGDSVTRQREVMVFYGPGDPVMGFACMSRAAYRPRSIPDSLPTALLFRNQAGVACWQFLESDGLVRLCCNYLALSGGMDAVMFKSICTKLLKEVAEVENGLHSKGLL